MPKKMEQEEFIKRCKEIFGDDYSYERTIYKNISSSVIITCKQHGDFKKKPSQMLYENSGCLVCNKNGNDILTGDD